MKKIIILEMMLSGKYDHLTIGEFGKICKETIEYEEEREARDEMDAEIEGRESLVKEESK